MDYDEPLIQFVRTEAYEDWYWRLRDRRAREMINARLRRFQRGNPGDVRHVGGGVSELRIHYGPGYRVYYLQRGCEVVILLAGGDKSTQRSDIARALELARTV